MEAFPAYWHRGVASVGSRWISRGVQGEGSDEA